MRSTVTVRSSPGRRHDSPSFSSSVAAQAKGLKVILHFNDVVKYGTGYKGGEVYPTRIRAWTDQVKITWS